MKTIQHAMLASSLLGCIPATAGTEPATDTAAAEAPTSNATGLLLGKLTGETAWDRAWSAFTLYKNEDNQILQEFSLQGRLQMQTIYGEDGGVSFNTSDYKDAGNDESVWGNDIEARRTRFGFKSKWFQNWKFEGQINVDTDGRDGTSDDHTLYKDLYDLFITYAQSDALNISAGKTKVKFSREQEISSKEILTIERSLLSNTLFPGELTGIWASGKGIADHWLYEFGVYGSDRQREFSTFNQGAVVLGKIGYDYSSQVGWDSAIAAFHYMHNSEPGYKSTKVESNYSFGTSPSFTDSIALTNDITHGRFGLTTELLYGFGYSGTPEGAKPIDQSDVFGLTIIPSYFIADGLQLVGRLQVASSSDPDGLRVPGRYERLVSGDDEKGNTYSSAYVGLNYYLYGHKLKLMNGIEYSNMGGGDYDGYTFMSGLRFSF
ncbi:MAG: porin [Luteolibacter sp.]|nr:porin [Luteolibacter sp.]